MAHFQKRLGWTILEVTVSIAVVGVLGALGLTAAQKARVAADRTTCINNQKNIILALHDIAGNKFGKLPDLGDREFRGDSSASYLFRAVAVHLAGNESMFFEENLKKHPKGKPLVPLFVCPSDPSISGAPGERRVGFATSYAGNAQVFGREPSVLASFPDGLSNTIAFAEHYAVNCGYNAERNSHTTFCWVLTLAEGRLSSRGTLSRPTFADGGGLPICHNDVVPVVEGNPPLAKGMWFRTKQKMVPEDMTFQVQPTFGKCYPRVPQTPHDAMVTGFADGSVRTLASTITHTTFWSLVTPAGGESVEIP